MTAEGGSEPAWLSSLVIRLIHQDQIDQHGGRSGVRDESLLESAAARPRNVWAYGDAPDLADLAAAYAQALARDHPFVDGNKRVAFMAAYTFLAVNGRDLAAPEAEAAAMVRALSAGELSEEGFATWIRRHTDELPE